MWESKRWLHLVQATYLDMESRRCCKESWNLAATVGVRGFIVTKRPFALFSVLEASWVLRIAINILLSICKKTKKNLLKNETMYIPINGKLKYGLSIRFKGLITLWSHNFARGFLKTYAAVNFWKVALIKIILEYLQEIANRMATKQHCYNELIIVDYLWDCKGKNTKRQIGSKVSHKVSD